MSEEVVRMELNADYMKTISISFENTLLNLNFN